MEKVSPSRPFVFAEAPYCAGRISGMVTAAPFFRRIPRRNSTEVTAAARSLSLNTSSDDKDVFRSSLSSRRS